MSRQIKRVRTEGQERRRALKLARRARLRAEQGIEYRPSQGVSRVRVPLWKLLRLRRKAHREPALSWISRVLISLDAARQRLLSGSAPLCPYQHVETDEKTKATVTYEPCNGRLRRVPSRDGREQFRCRTCGRDWQPIGRGSALEPATT